MFWKLSEMQAYALLNMKGCNSALPKNLKIAHSDEKKKRISLKNLNKIFWYVLKKKEKSMEN